jgi:hypothetical protein
VGRNKGKALEKSKRGETRKEVALAPAPAVSDALRYGRVYDLSSVAGPSSRGNIYRGEQWLETPEGAGASSVAATGSDVLRNVSYWPGGQGEGGQGIVHHALDLYPEITNAPSPSGLYESFPVDMSTPGPASAPSFLQGWASGHERETSGKKLKLDITNVQPTLAHLDAEALYNRNYGRNGGLEQMRQEHPEQAHLVKELQAMVVRGTAEQKAEIQEVRAQQTALLKQPRNIEGVQPTSAHLQAESLYTRDYARNGGLEQMRQEHPEQAHLVKELHAVKWRGTAEQKNALQELRAQRAMQKGRKKLARRNNESVAPAQQEQARSSSQAMGDVEQQSYEMYVAIYQHSGEDGLRHMQQEYPASYETAVAYMQALRAQAERR